MMIIRTSAIVLRRIDFQESSCIVTLFTREQGKCGFLAKGARNLKSKFIGKLDPGNLVEIIFHHKPARSIQWLTEVQHLSQRTSSGHSLHHYLVSIALADLVYRVLEDHQVNTALFDNLAAVIHWLHATQVDPLPLFPYIMIRLATWMGIGLQLQDERLLQRPTDHFSLNPERGLLQPGHNLKGYSVSVAMNDYVQKALRGEKKSLMQINLSNAEMRQLVYVFDAYFSYHFDGIRPRTAEILFDTFQDITL